MQTERVAECGCTFRVDDCLRGGGVHLHMAPDGCVTHGVGNQDTISRRNYPNYVGQEPISAFVRPRGLSLVWKPRPGGTL